MGHMNYEDFGADAAAAAILKRDGVRLEGYDAGYRAGWDDAVAADAEEQGRLSDALLASMADLSFGFTEAQHQILAALRPVFDALSGTVLPHVAERRLASQIAAMAETLATTAAQAPIVLRAHPDRSAKMAELVEQASGLALRIEADPALAPDQIELGNADTGVTLDLGAVLTDVDALIEAAFDTEPHQEEIS